MIVAINKSGDNKAKIQFIPRAGFAHSQTLERELIYAHKCPVCNNIMQAYFKTPTPINLWPYEETTILSQGEKNGGEVLKIIPNNQSTSNETCYKSDFDKIEGGHQKIVLKNHIVRQRVIAERKYTGEGIWEVGERPCFWTGVFTLREDLLVKDLLLHSKCYLPSY
jgi:hypothetical protein